MAYSKLVIYKELLDSKLPDEPYFAHDLKRYFPIAMQKNFADAIENHQLKREIIATVVTNSIVNRAGITFFFDIAQDVGATARDVVATYTLARDAFALRSLWDEIEKAEGITVATRVEMYTAAGEFLERVTTWILRNIPQPLDIDRAISEILPGIAEIEKHGAALHSDTTRKASNEMFERLKGQGVAAKLAQRIAGLEVLSSALDIIAVSHYTKLGVEKVGKTYFELGARLNLGWLRLCASRVTTASHWDRLAAQSMVSDLFDEQRRLSIGVIETYPSVKEWETANPIDLGRFDRFIADLKAGDSIDIPKLMVAIRHVKSLGMI